MTDRIYAEDIARERGISVRAARDVLHSLPPAKVRKDGRRLYTTKAALEASGDPDDRIDDVVERIDFLLGVISGQGDEIAALTGRVGAIEERETHRAMRSGGINPGDF